MSAPWMDLSAHNLALWRIGLDQDGLRLYVLRPIFQDMPNAFAADLRTSAGQSFTWDAQERAYILRIRPGQEKLPSPGAWLKAYPGALQRDRAACTFDPHRRSLLELSTLPLANPWAWSNADHPDRCFANEDQALADGESKAVLRADVEVDPRMVRELYAVATLETDSLPQESQTSENAEDATGTTMPDEAPQLPADPEPTETAAQPEAEGGDTQASHDAQRRSDYGERIEGARKHAFENWLTNLRAQQTLAAQGAQTPDGLKRMASETRKDTLIGAKQKAESLKGGSPVLLALWEAVNAMIPASAASTPMKKHRHMMVRENLMMARIVGYAEVVSAIGRRFDALQENMTDDSLSQNLFSDLWEPKPRAWAFDALVPKDYYDGNHALMSDKAMQDTTGEGLRPLREALDSGAFSLPALLSAISNDSATTIRRKLAYEVLKSSFAVAVPQEDLDDAVTPFYLEAETVSRIFRNVDYLRSSATEFSESRFKFFLSRDYFAQNGVSEEAYKAASQDEKKAILDSCYAQNAERASKVFLEDFKTLAHKANDYFCLETVVDRLGGYTASEDKMDKDPAYREQKAAERRFLTAMIGASLRYQAMASALAPRAPEEPDAIAMTTPMPAGREDAGPEKTEPDFLKWDSGAALPLPNASQGNSYREGPTTERGERDITEKELCDRFGFRGVQYGNWMTQKDRQEHLNAAFDSCCDLQDLMGFEEAAMVGLPRKRAGTDRQWLAIALGARGRGGRAAAHYEPDQHVINLTKTSGAGALLHEWTHAADAFMGAEITNGQNVLESNLAVKSAQQTPFAAFAQILCEGPSTQTREDRNAATASFLRAAHPDMKKALCQVFLSEDVQRSVFNRVQEKLMGEDRWAKTDEAAVRRRAARDEAIAIYESSLPRMAAWVESKLALLDTALHQASSQNDRHPLRGGEGSIGDVLKTHFADPFFSLTGLTARWRTDHVTGLLKEALMPKDATPEQAYDVTLMSTAWAEAMRRDAWKKMAGPIFNNKTAYDKALGKITSKSSQFYAESKSLGDYWERPHELVARAVAAIGYDGLATRNIRNTYLTTSAPSLFSDTTLYRADPDPQGTERAFFAQEFAKKCLPALRVTLRLAVQQKRECQQDEDAKTECSMAI